MPRKYEKSFDPCKTYFMGGCLGGLGRSISRYMVRNGARSFLYLSRSGLSKSAAKQLAEDLESAGAEAMVSTGDVRNRADVECAMDAAKHPLGGVVQAAMGLHVSSGMSLFVICTPLIAA